MLTQTWFCPCFSFCGMFQQTPKIVLLCFAARDVACQAGESGEAKMLLLLARLRQRDGRNKAGRGGCLGGNKRTGVDAFSEPLNSEIFIALWIV